ncbi:MAG: choice-of-anchor J domain-containing protein [Bacteroidales bacterium]
MKKALLLPAFIFISTFLQSQNIDNLHFGTDATLEVVSWNIEWFPKNDQVTVDYVTDIILNMDAEIIAVQEVSDTVFFKQMLDNLEGYTGFFRSSYFAGLAYIYKDTEIEVNDIYEIYTNQPYWRPFPRSPVVMDFQFNGENYIVINNHFKCCGDGYMDLSDSWDEETRRFDAMNLLKEYVDTHFNDKKVMIVGDLNDLITDEWDHNVFRNVIDDEENYLFADYDIAHGSINYWSYPSWPSHLDHIIITSELFDEFSAPFTYVRTLRVEDYLAGGWSEYDWKVSDHRPVGMRFLAGHNVLLGKDFEDQELLSGGWTQHNLSGEEIWQVPVNQFGLYNSYFAYINGYDAGAQENENWLVSPAVYKENNQNLQFSFWNTSGYSGPQLEVFYAMDYDNDPLSATWELMDEVNYHDGDVSWQWVYSGEIDLDHLPEGTLHIGFKYTSTTSNAAAWEVDDILLTSNLQTFEIIADTFPVQSGTTSGTGTYNYGSVATLTATPGEGYRFVNWTENGNVASTQETYSFSVLRNRDLTANFEAATAIVAHHDSFRLYPNPASKTLYVEGLNPQAKVQIFNIVGVLVSNQYLLSGSLDVSNLSPGVYFLKVEKGGDFLLERFVKQ